MAANADIEKRLRARIAELQGQLRAKSARNPRHMAGSFEYSTPAYLVSPARELLGGIDLDPASCTLANCTIRAARFFSQMDDGLAQPWRARSVFLNPPGGIDDEVGSRQKAWWFKLAHHHGAGDVDAAIFVSFSIELLQTTQQRPPRGLALPHDFPICFPASRVAYSRMFRRRRLVLAKQPPHASALIFLPPRAGRAAAIRRFEDLFSGIGRVITPRAIAR